MSIEEGNKIIAEFMGETGLAKVFHDKIVPYDKQYNNIWQNIMPVVEKIESINDPHHGHFGVHIVSNGCTIQATNFRPNKLMAEPPHYFADWYGDTKLQATWIAVTQFIQWYNKTKS